MIDGTFVWNIILTAGIGIVSWIIKGFIEEVKRLSILVNKTREEIAKEYVTKAEVHADINRVIARLESLDAKLDRMIEATNRKV